MYILEPSVGEDSIYFAWKIPTIFMQLQTVIRLSSYNNVSASSGLVHFRKLNFLSQQRNISEAKFDFSTTRAHWEKPF